MHFLRLLCFVLAVGVTAVEAALVPVPPLRGPVTDLTGTLTPEHSRQLEELLKAFELRKGSQVAVLLVPTTRPETIEQYGIRVAEAWKLGRKGVDDGALLLVAKDDRALRIEVGYGLEGVLPDAVAKRIIEDVILPFFKQGDFPGGIDAGLRRIIQSIDGEPLPPPTPTHRGMEGLVRMIPFVFLAIPVLGGLLRLLFGRLPAAALGSLVTVGVLWFLSAPLVMIVIVALFVFLILLASGGTGLGPNHGRSGGWSSRSGGRSGGGFSGGGGGFGGGGASGRW